METKTETKIAKKSNTTAIIITVVAFVGVSLLGYFVYQNNKTRKTKQVKQAVQ